MLPLLQLAAAGEEHRARDAVAELAEKFRLRDEERCFQVELSPFSITASVGPAHTLNRRD